MLPAQVLAASVLFRICWGVRDLLHCLHAAGMEPSVSARMHLLNCSGCLQRARLHTGCRAGQSVYGHKWMVPAALLNLVVPTVQPLQLPTGDLAQRHSSMTRSTVSILQQDMGRATEAQLHCDPHRMHRKKSLGAYLRWLLGGWELLAGPADYLGLRPCPAGNCRQLPVLLQQPDPAVCHLQQER